MNCKYYKCENPTTSKKSDICKTHYHHEWRKANPDKLKAQAKRYYEGNKQKIAEYNKKYRKKNADSHRSYSRQYMAKNANNPVTQEHMTDALKERFFAKVDKTDTCWNWTSAKTAYKPKRIASDATKGYGFITINGRPFYAHRASWLMHKGPLVDGLVIDHLCNNTLCVNPDHLQQVTTRENTGRSPKYTGNGARYNWYSETCKRGHKRGIELKGKPCPECYRLKHPNTKMFKSSLDDEHGV
jgi:hypothetical protein